MLKLAALALALTAVAPAAFADDADQVFAFLHDNLAHKRLVTEFTGTIAGGTIYTEFKRTNVYSDLRRADDGLSYKLAWVIQQTNWDIENGQRTDRKYVKDRFGTYECEASVRKSTGKLLGYCRLTYNSMPKASLGRVDELSLTLLDGGKLVESMHTVGYADCYATVDTYKPCSVTVDRTFAKDGDLWTAVDEDTTYTLDPATRQTIGEPTRNTLTAREVR